MAILHDFFCPDCRTVFEELVSSLDEEVSCTNCGFIGACTVVPTAVGIRTENSATFVDGTKRKGFRELGESYAIESKMYELPLEKRGEMQKEIDRLRTVKT